MKSPGITQKGLFVGGVGCLLISVLFSVNSWPAAELFSVLGAVITLGFYFWFQKSNSTSKKSGFARHLTIVLLVLAVVLKSFGLTVAGFLFLFAFIAFLIWFVWSVLEELPTSEE